MQRARIAASNSVSRQSTAGRRNPAQPGVPADRAGGLLPLEALAVGRPCPRLSGDHVPAFGRLPGGVAAAGLLHVRLQILEAASVEKRRGSAVHALGCAGTDVLHALNGRTTRESRLPLPLSYAVEHPQEEVA
jgi:hypothetical protein